MPYSTERGVTSYSDRDTPPEFASGEDEDRAEYNGARDAAFAAAEKLCSLLDELYEPATDDLHGEAHRLDRMSGKLLAMVVEAERLLGRALKSEAA